MFSCDYLMMISTEEHYQTLLSRNEFRVNLYNVYSISETITPDIIKTEEVSQ